MQQRDPSTREASHRHDVAPGRSSTLARAQIALIVLAGLAAAAWYGGRPYIQPYLPASWGIVAKPGGPAATAPQPPPPQVTVAKPIARDVVETLEFTGRFAASDSVDIRSRVAGYIETIHFADGSFVKKGEPLFTIDQRPSKFAIEQAEAAIKNALARIEFAQADMSRADALRQSGITTQTIAEQRRRDLLVAQADLQAAQAAAGRARLDFDYAQIKAPFTGQVGRRNVSIGNLVKVDDTILTTIVATDPMYFYFDVDERSVLTALRPQLDSLTAKTPAPRVEVQIALTDETDARHKGVLDFTDNRLDDATGTLRTRALVANAGNAVKPGMFGRIRIPSLKPTPAILIPDEAIGSDQDRRIVYVVGDGNTVKAQTITPGPRIDGYRVVRTGLTGSETIIVNGLLRVRPGVKVTPKLTTLPDTPTPPGAAPANPPAQPPAKTPTAPPSSPAKG